MEQGHEKLQKICEILRDEAIEPAQRKAQEIVEDAEKQAIRIVEEAKAQAKKTIDEAKAVIEAERAIFSASLSQAGKQAVEALRQEIEKTFFHDELYQKLEKHLRRPEMIAELMRAIIHAIEKSGMSNRLAAEIPKELAIEEVNAYLGQEMLNKLAQGTVQLGSFGGGVKVRLCDRHIALEITTESLLELLMPFLRKGFRNLLFSP